MKIKQILIKPETLLLAIYLFLCTGAFLYIGNATVRSLFGSSSCQLYEYFGLYCPACGGTRAMIFLLQGNIVSALQHNFLIILFPLVIITGIFLFTLVLKGHSLNKVSLNPFLPVGLLLIIILYGILRNIPTPFFDVLRPP